MDCADMGRSVLRPYGEEKTMEGSVRRGGGLGRVTELSTDCKKRGARDFCRKGGITMQGQRWERY